MRNTIGFVTPRIVLLLDCTAVNADMTEDVFIMPEHNSIFCKLGVMQDSFNILDCSS